MQQLPGFCCRHYDVPLTLSSEYTGGVAPLVMDLWERAIFICTMSSLQSNMIDHSSGTIGLCLIGYEVKRSVNDILLTRSNGSFMTTNAKIKMRELQSNQPLPKSREKEMNYVNN